MALEHTHSAISEAKSLACEASEIHGSPSVRSAAACKIKLRAAFKRVCMSASMLPTLWCSIIGLPNCSRSCARSEEHTSELQSRFDLVCRLLLEKKKDS